MQYSGKECPEKIWVQRRQFQIRPQQFFVMKTCSEQFLSRNLRPCDWSIAIHTSIQVGFNFFCGDEKSAVLTLACSSSASANSFRTFASDSPTYLSKIWGPFTIFGSRAFSILPICLQMETPSGSIKKPTALHTVTPLVKWSYTR